MTDKAGCRSENVCGRAVVAFQANGFCIRKVFVEAQNIFNLGAAPRINRLVVVADAAKVAVFLAEQADEEVLGDVSILILVDHNVFEA